MIAIPVALAAAPVVVTRAQAALVRHLRRPPHAIRSLLITQVLFGTIYSPRQARLMLFFSHRLKHLAIGMVGTLLRTLSTKESTQVSQWESWGLRRLLEEAPSLLLKTTSITHSVAIAVPISMPRRPAPQTQWHTMKMRPLQTIVHCQH